MAYTHSQLRALAGMGLVPWVLRSTKNATVPRDTGSPEPVSTGQLGHLQTKPGLVDQTTEACKLRTVIAAASQHAAPERVTERPVEPPVKSIADRQAPTPVAQSSPVAQSNDLLRTPLVSIPFRGRYCTQLGNPDASLLILVEAISTQQSQYPFEPADAKVFEDMLRAISWRRQDVCLAVVQPMAQGSLVADEQGACVADLIRSPRDAVLFFGLQVPQTQNVDELLVSMSHTHKADAESTGEQNNTDTPSQSSLRAWQLPHPALLRESPDRKRQAWEVLKAARARLG